MLSLSSFKLPPNAQFLPTQEDIARITLKTTIEKTRGYNIYDKIIETLDLLHNSSLTNIRLGIIKIEFFAIFNRHKYLTKILSSCSDEDETIKIKKEIEEAKTIMTSIRIEMETINNLCVASKQVSLLMHQYISKLLPLLGDDSLTANFHGLGDVANQYFANLDQEINLRVRNLTQETLRQADESQYNNELFLKDWIRNTSEEIKDLAFSVIEQIDSVRSLTETLRSRRTQVSAPPSHSAASTPALAAQTAEQTQTPESKAYKKKKKKAERAQAMALKKDQILEEKLAKTQDASIDTSAAAPEAASAQVEQIVSLELIPDSTPSALDSSVFFSLNPESLPAIPKSAEYAAGIGPESIFLTQKSDSHMQFLDSWQEVQVYEVSHNPTPFEESALASAEQKKAMLYEDACAVSKIPCFQSPAAAQIIPPLPILEVAEPSKACLDLTPAQLACSPSAAAVMPQAKLAYSPTIEPAVDAHAHLRVSPTRIKPSSATEAESMAFSSLPASAAASKQKTRAKTPEAEPKPCELSLVASMMLSSEAAQIMKRIGLTSIEGRGIRFKLFGYISDAALTASNEYANAFEKALAKQTIPSSSIQFSDANILELRINGDPRILGRITSDSNEIRSMLTLKRASPQEVSKVLRAFGDELKIVSFDRYCPKHGRLQETLEELSKATPAHRGGR